MGILKDSRGRRMRKLRVSVTDPCNFRCVYCMPEDIKWLERAEILRFEEIEHLVRIFATLGVNQVRLTGGEPFMRRDLHYLISLLKRIPGIEKVSVTTNGVLFPRFAEAVKEAGLDGVNFSLDTLKRERFVEICRKDALPEVLSAISLAKALGFSPVKVNCVVIRGMNEDEIPEMLEWSIRKGLILRFIEFMPFDGKGEWNRNRVVSLEEMLRIASQVGKVKPMGGREPQAAVRFWLKNARFEGEFGVIPSITAPFCESCNRIRLTADGIFLNCLFQPHGVDLKGPLREGKTEAEIAEIIRTAVWEKPLGYELAGLNWKPAKPGMYAIGG